MAVASVRAHHAAILELLRAIDPNHLSVFDGEVGTPPKNDNDKRVHPYVVLYADAGRPWAPAMCGDSTSLAWTFEVACIGGDPTRVLWAVDKVREALTDVELVVAGRVSHRMREDYTTAMRRETERDDTTRPARFSVSLLFRADSHAA